MFTDERAIGENSVRISQNHQYSSISPNINFTPGTTTEVSANMRTIREQVLMELKYHS